MPEPSRGLDWTLIRASFLHYEDVPWPPFSILENRSFSSSHFWCISYFSSLSWEDWYQRLQNTILERMLLPILFPLERPLNLSWSSSPIALRIAPELLWESFTSMRVSTLHFAWTFFVLLFYVNRALLCVILIGRGKCLYTKGNGKPGWKLHGFQEHQTYLHEI